MKNFGPLIWSILLLIATAAIGQTKSSPPHHPADKTSPKAVHAGSPDRGQQVFQHNCSRCHNAPEGFSPRISGTIAMHMRTRATLSEADYRALLRFLNP